MASQIGARLAFDNAKAMLADRGYDPNAAVLSQSVIRTEVAMSTTQTQYTFPILINDAQQGVASSFNTMKLLNLQDAFIVSALGVYVANPASSTATNFPLLTFPDAQVFTTSGAAAALYSFYNGNLSVTVNNRQIVPAYDLARHVKVPRTQTATSTGTNTAVNSHDGSIDGIYPIEPNWVLVGSKNTQVVATLPSALSAIQAGSAPRFILKFYGVLAQNVTPVR